MFLSFEWCVRPRRDRGNVEHPELWSAVRPRIGRSQNGHGHQARRRLEGQQEQQRRKLVAKLPERIETVLEKVFHHRVRSLGDAGVEH